MRKFDHMTIHVSPTEDIIARLNAFGAIGWEPWWRIDLAKVIIIYLKREKQDA